LRDAGGINMSEDKLEYLFNKDIVMYKVPIEKFNDLKVYKVVEAYTHYYTDKQLIVQKKSLQHSFIKLSEYQINFNENLEKMKKQYEKNYKKMLDRKTKEYKEYMKLYKKWLDETKEKKTYEEYCKLVIDQSIKVAEEYMRNVYENNKQKLEKIGKELSMIEGVLEKGESHLKEKFGELDLEVASKLTDDQIKEYLKKAGIEQ